MRRIVLFFIYVISLTVHAQENYFPMLANGRTWNMRDSYYGEPPKYYSKTLVGPVEFDGKSCYQCGDSEYYFEEDKKVYSYVDSQGEKGRQWVLEYDFGAEIGEFCSICSMDTVEINGVLRKRFFFWSNQRISIEGIGSNIRGLRASGRAVPGSYMGSDVLSVYDGDENLCTQDDFIKPAYNASIKYSLLSEEKQWTVRQIVLDDESGNGHEEIFGYILKGHYGGNKYYGDIPFMGIYSKKQPSATWAASLYLGQKNEKVYLLLETSPEAKLLQVMDFSLNEGDTYRQYDFDMDNHIDYIVTSVSDIIIESSTDKTVKKCIHVQRVDNPQIQDVWVEGIGSLAYGFYGMYGAFLECNSSTLLDCSKDDIIFYRDNNYVMANEYIDPQTGVCYTYEPEQETATVKAGSMKMYESYGKGYFIYKSGNPDVSGDITILSHFIVDGQEYTVTDIGEFAFYRCEVTSVVIPETITTIREGAFFQCLSLASVNLPQSITTLESGAFCACRSLTAIIIPPSINRIENGVFKGCENLQSVDIPNSVTSIEYYAFCRCLSLTSIDIPESVTSIGHNAFSYSGLKSVTIPATVTEIGGDAFIIPSLTKIVSLIEEPYWVQLFGYPYVLQVYDNATLYVPKGCKAKYEAVHDWNLFKKILELDASDIHEMQGSVKQESTAAIYDLQGRRLTDKPQKGIYIQNGKLYVVK